MKKAILSFFLALITATLSAQTKSAQSTPPLTEAGLQAALGGLADLNPDATIRVQAKKDQRDRAKVVRAAARVRPDPTASQTMSTVDSTGPPARGS